MQPQHKNQTLTEQVTQSAKYFKTWLLANPQKTMKAQTFFSFRSATTSNDILVLVLYADIWSGWFTIAVRNDMW